MVSPAFARSRLTPNGLLRIHTITPEFKRSRLPQLCLTLMPPLCLPLLPHMVWFASTRVSHASSRSGLAQHVLACLHTFSPAFARYRLPLHGLACHCTVSASTRSRLPPHSLACQALPAQDLACRHTVSPALTQCHLPPHSHRLACLRLRSPSAALSSVSILRCTFDGFLGLPRCQRGAPSASIPVPAAPAPAGASSALAIFLGRPPLLTGADLSPVHFQSTRTR